MEEKEFGDESPADRFTHSALRRVNLSTPQFSHLKNRAVGSITSKISFGLKTHCFSLCHWWLGWSVKALRTWVELVLKKGLRLDATGKGEGGEERSRRRNWQEDRLGGGIARLVA